MKQFLKILFVILLSGGLGYFFGWLFGFSNDGHLGATCIAAAIGVWLYSVAVEEESGRNE